jgi:membrane protein YqaA with SNARE-associated domain
VRPLFAFLFGFLLNWWGVVLMAALDSSMVFFLPFGVDIAVIILASRSPDLFWLYPLLASSGSLCGAAVTYYIGRQVGALGLEHFVPKKRLIGLRRRIEDKGAIALAVLDLLPPPFPFTACILVAGALKVSTPLFFITLGLTRLLRFGAEAVLAYFYGRQIINWLESDVVEYIGTALLVAAVIGTGITLAQFIRNMRAHRKPGRPRDARLAASNDSAFPPSNS